MNITAITYNNYQSGFIYNSVSNANSDKPEQTTKDQASQANDPSDPNPEQQNDSNTPVDTGVQLSQAELQLVEELGQVDNEVRRHEMAHIAVGGRYITSGANFTYTRGPDGKNYVVGGEVGIDTSPVPGDPEATIRKMRQIKSAALAPANPSSQDLKIASNATSAGSKALSDLMVLQAKEQADSNENEAFGNVKKAAASYETIDNLPEEETSTFQIAV